MNLISIIIPMYNEEENITSCIDVLKSQKNQKFEVLFVDDGSTDSTLEILNKSLNADVKFDYKIIEQSNQGAAEARKKGIKNAFTEFIMVFDCDDKLSNNMIGEIYENYNKVIEVDIIVPNMYIQNASGDWREFVFYTADKILNPLDCVKNSLDGWAVHGCFAIKRSIINKSYIDYQFHNVNDTNYINNDEVITRLNFANANVIIRSSASYYYCHNTSSTTKSINDKRYLTIKNALILNDFFSNNEVVELSAKAELIAVLWSNLIYMRKNDSKLQNQSEWKSAIREAVDQLNYFVVLRRLSLKKKIQLTALKLIH